MPRKARELQGQKFGKLLVIGRALTPKGKHWAYWQCVCDCGNEPIIAGPQLRPKNRSSCGCGQSYYRLRPYESLFNWIKTRGIKHGKYDGLTYEEFLDFVSKPECFYCGEVLNWAEFSYRAKNRMVNLDRINSSKGYSKANCVPCCWNCNTMKSDLKQDVFLDQIERIHNHQKGKVE